jgi:hypothetical protein
VRVIASNTWTRLTFDFPNEPIRSFSGGNGVLSTASGLCVLEHLAIVPAAGTGTYSVYLDNFAVVGPRTFTFSLGVGAPDGASIHAATGIFMWTPTPAQSPSTNQIAIVVTDNSSPPLRATNTFTVIIRENAPNSAPVLYPIENRTIHAGSTLSFTNVAYDPDPGDILTFSLDAGRHDPPGDRSFQLDHHTCGHQFHPLPHRASDRRRRSAVERRGDTVKEITVRVTDNGYPPMSGAATFSATVLPRLPNNPPVLAPIADWTVHAGSTITFTNSADDPDSADTLVFSLDEEAPLGAEIDLITGVFTWTPSDEQINTTNSITVLVTDDGEPPLSASATFTAIVRPRPGLQSVSASNDTAVLTWSAIPGTTYRVQYKNDLAEPAWETLGPDVTASDSLATAMDSDLAGIPQRFYRIIVAD